MKNTKVILAPLEAGDREQFILDNQASFKYGAVEEFGYGTTILRRTAKSFPVRQLSKALMRPTARHIEFCMMA